MTTISLSDAQADLAAVIQLAGHERVVLKHDGQPVAILTGLRSYDDEDLATARSLEFWQMIEDRRTRALFAGCRSPGPTRKTSGLTRGFP